MSVPTAPLHPLFTHLHLAPCLQTDPYAVYQQGHMPSGSGWFGQWRAPTGEKGKETVRVRSLFPWVSLCKIVSVWLCPSFRNHWSFQYSWLYVILSSFRFQRPFPLPIPSAQKGNNNSRDTALCLVVLLTHTFINSPFMKELCQTIILKGSPISPGTLHVCVRYALGSPHW